MARKDGFSPRTRLLKKQIDVPDSVDPETGEVTEGRTVERTVDVARYVKIYDVKVLLMLGIEGFRTLLYVMSVMTYGSQLRFVVKDAVEFTGMPKTSVYRGMTQLIDLGILKKVCNGTYNINPNVLYRGRRELYRVNPKRKPSDSGKDVVTSPAPLQALSQHRHNPPQASV